MKKIKKLYLISYFFAPLGRADGVNRAYMTKYLSENGWDIEVFSCSNPHGFLQSFQKDYSLMKIIPTSIKLHRPKSTYWGPLGGIVSLLGITRDPFGNWYGSAVKEADSIITDRGIIYAIVPPVTNARVAHELAIKKQMPLVIDFRDNVYNLPKNIVQSCRTIIASTNQSLEEMRHYFDLAPDIGITMYNGYPRDIFSESIRSNEDGNLKFVYAGVLSIIQDPAMLARAVKLMEKRYPDSRGRVSVEYYGPLNYYTCFFLKKHLCNNICFNGYLPFNMILEKIAAADYGYASLSPKGYGYAIPSKVFQYISMETPILGTGPNGALRKLIEENGIGRFSLANDIDGQAEDLYYLLNHPEDRIKMVENIQKIKPEFAMKLQVGKLSKHLEQVTSRQDVL